MIEWHGGKPFAICSDCEKPVQLNKPLLGAAHICTPVICEKRGHHSGPFFTVERVGWFWNRRDEYRCTDCREVVQPPLGYRVIAMERT